MKQILSLILFIPFFGSAQKSEVVMDSADKKEVLFSKSLQWVTTNWNSANNVVQMKDEAAGMIIVKGGMASVPKTMGIPAKGITMTQVTIQVKDGKAKISFDNTTFKWETGTVWTADSTASGRVGKWTADCDKEMTGLITSYKTAIVKPSADF